MKRPPAEPAQWTRGRFLGLVGVLFVLQAGLILLFAEREQSSSHVVPPPGHFGLVRMPLTADQLSKKFFASDPTVFSLPNLHGFSERAWLRPAAQQFEMPSETEAPAWLTNDAVQLGTNFPQLSGAKSVQPFGLPAQRGPDSEPWPAFLSPEVIKTQSILEIEGDLAGRPFNTPAGLPAWPSAQLLANSVVQIAVDSAGQVIAARLLARSGSTDADTNALDKARNLRFRPASSPAPVWGNAVFEWQTVEPTNASPAAAP